MITYSYVSTQGRISATLSHADAHATLASLEAQSHRHHTPQAIANRKAEAKAIRAALSLAPMGSVVAHSTDPDTSMAFSDTACEMHAEASEYASH